MAAENKTQQQLFKQAKRVRTRAHAPYSRFKVGAALLDDQGKVHLGCNVENASYGGTICAERAAIMAMVAAGGKRIIEIAVVTDTPQGCPPCGLCRQVISEFSARKHPTRVHLATLDKVTETITMDKLLPHAFDSGFLK